MKIEKHDKNFAKTATYNQGMNIKVPSHSVNLYGLIYDEKEGFIRMPTDISNNVSEGVAWLNRHTAGGRISFSTDSRFVTIKVSYPSLDKMYHMPLTGQAGFSLEEVRNDKEYHRFTYVTSFDDANGYFSSSKLLKTKKMRNYVLYFPLYNRVGSLELVLEDDSIIKPYVPYKEIKPILYYGNSITQGGCASRADNSYQSMVTKEFRIDHINLGFSGNGKGEDLMADYLANIPCSCFVIDYDHNAPTVEHLKATHEKLFLKFRKNNPDTPVIFLSASNYYVDKNIYEPRRKVVEETYKNALARGDKNVYFIDGRKIYPKKVREYCTVDDAHPNDLGFYYFYQSIAKILRKLIKQGDIK